MVGATIMLRVVIQEQAFRRLVIDVDPYIAYGRGNQDRTFITFEHSNAASAAARVVEAWIIQAAKQQDHVQSARTRHLPELILEHASEWGLQ